MTSRSLPFTAALVTLLSVACGEATGEAIGGELTEAGASAATPPVGEAFVDLSTGTKWSDLYRDYFGGTFIDDKGQVKKRPGNCAFESGCHTQGEAGFKSSNFECIDQKGCLASLIKQGWIRPTRDPAAPEKSLFLGILKTRPVDDGEIKGRMPLRPDGFYSKVAVARITAWLRNGAQDD